MLIVSAERARAELSRAVLGEGPPAVVLGEIVLRPHQADAVARLRELLDRDGGALLADAVGLGKTYVALALARAAARPLIVAPAALRDMWTGAMARCGVRAAFVSYERLSRGGAPKGAFDLIVADEAHHARNPATRRWAALATLTAHARVLLLSATPVHNRRRDLASLLSLVLGARAFECDDATLARSVVRRVRADVAETTLPKVEALRWISLPPEMEIAERIIGLPSPLPPADGGDGGALLSLSLLRQWASSRGALRGALRRRLLRASALGAALANAQHPTRAQLATWIAGEDAVQLMLPGLDAPAAGSTRALLEAVREHESSVRALLHELDGLPDPDIVRAQRIAELRARHPGESIIVFSHYAATVASLWRRLRVAPRVAALGARGGVAAGGTLSRAEVIARFAPRANGHPPPREAERIDLLLTTDLLSEGVNLQDASVVVHADLPWTPARLEQRVGRLARPGAPAGTIAVYALTPPAEAEHLLALERRLQAKLGAAARAIGVAADFFSGFIPTTEAVSRSPPELRQRIRSVLAPWNTVRAPPAGAPTNGLFVAAVGANTDGFVVLLLTDDGPQLLASLGDALTDDSAIVLAALSHAGGAPAAVLIDRCRAALSAIDDWNARRRGKELSGLTGAAALRARRAIVARIAAIARSAPAHARPRLGPLALAAREAALAPLGIGAERELASLARSDLPDEAWLRAIGAFAAHETGNAGTARRRGAGASDPPAERPRARVLILFVRQP